MTIMPITIPAIAPPLSVLRLIYADTPPTISANPKIMPSTIPAIAPPLSVLDSFDGGLLVMIVGAVKVGMMSATALASEVAPRTAACACKVDVNWLSRMS